MRKFTVLWSAAVFALVASAAYAQSLGDLADKEQQRRERVKNDRVISDEEAAKLQGESTKPHSGAPQAAPAAAETKAGADQAFKADPDEPVDFQGRPESYWRKTMTEARQNVKNLEIEENALVLKRNSLQDQFYKEADGYRRETIQRDIQKTIYEQDLNKENLAKAKNALQDLENEARKSGALPGWLN